jgi:hypothetical protein
LAILAGGGRWDAGCVNRLLLSLCVLTPSQQPFSSIFVQAAFENCWASGGFDLLLLGYTRSAVRPASGVQIHPTSTPPLDRIGKKNAPWAECGKQKWKMDRDCKVARLRRWRLRTFRHADRTDLARGRWNLQIHPKLNMAVRRSETSHSPDV